MATALNLNVLVNSAASGPATALMFAMVSLAAVAVVVALFVFATIRADVIIPWVVAWALLGRLALDPKMANKWLWKRHLQRAERPGEVTRMHRRAKDIIMD